MNLVIYITFLCHLRWHKSYDIHCDTQGKVTSLANSAIRNTVLYVKEEEISEDKREITKEMY